MERDIKRFSSMFAFGHTASSTEETDLCFKISHYDDLLEYDSILESVQTLSMCLRESFFETLLEIMRTNESFASKEKFMSCVLSRCRKLSEAPTPFNFVVVCAFIHSIVFAVCNEVECFRVIKMASKCVTAAFHRWYVDLYDKEDGFTELSYYCQKLNVTVLDSSIVETDSEHDMDLEGFVPPDIDTVVDLLQSFKEIDDSEFPLTDFEKKLLYDLDELPSNIDPAEDIFIPNDRSSKPNEVKCLGLAMENLSINSKKVLDRLNDLCPLCKDNCYKNVVLVAKELGVI